VEEKTPPSKEKRRAVIAGMWRRLEVKKNICSSAIAVTLTLASPAMTQTPYNNASVQPAGTQVSQQSGEGSKWQNVGVGLGTVAGNILYIPAKLAYGILGGITGGASYVITGGNQQTANTVWRSTLGGDYVLTPDMITGQEPIHFSGPTTTGPVPSDNITERHQLVSEKLPRPNHIWVYNFATRLTDVPSDSSMTSELSEESTPQTAEQIEIGRQLGGEIAKELVADIQGMGLPAEEASSGTSPQVNDIVIRGYFLSIEQGSTGQRFVIGFGSGSSELKTAVEGYQMTPQGLRKLGSGTVSSASRKTPGIIVPAVVAAATANPIGLIVVGGTKIYGEASGSSRMQGRAKKTADEIAEQLRIRFQEQGWIS
jgi:uncharacterized protein DUF4410